MLQLRTFALRPELADVGAGALESAPRQAEVRCWNCRQQVETDCVETSPPRRQSQKIDPVTCPCGATIARDASCGAWVLARRRDTDFFQHNRPCVDLVEQAVRSACGIIPPSPADLTANELPMRLALWPPCLWRGPPP